MASAGEPPAPGFHLLARVDVDGLIAYRFVSPVARRVSAATLRRHVITLASPEVLGFAGAQVSCVGGCQWERACATVVQNEKI